MRMRRFPILTLTRLFAVSILCACELSCEGPLEDVDPPVNIPNAVPDLDPSDVLVFSKSYDISIPEQVLDHRKVDGHLFEVRSPEVKSPEAFDLYLQVFPLYAFGNDYASGDYYCVEGYMLSHNALIYAERADRDVKICGWYPSEYNLEFELLSPEGKPMNANEVEFLVRPEPSSTIGSTTYKKGSTFTLDLKVTFGPAKKEKLSDALSWINALLGSFSFGYKYESSATQNIPDQTVLQTTGVGTESVSYSFKTNNDTGGYKTSDIPSVFRKDQYIAFSWVWHLKKGYYCANDNDFGNMKMRATVKPTYKAAYNGKIVNTYGRAIFKGRALYQHNDLTVEFNMPAINRIPTGDIKLTFAIFDDSYTLSDLSVYRTGEYTTAKEPYYSDSRIYCKNEIITIPLRVGKYDIVYEILNGSDGTSSKKIITGVNVSEDSTTELSTFKGTDL